MHFLCLISSLTQIHMHMYVCCVCMYIATHILYIYLKAVLFSHFITDQDPLPYTLTYF